LRESVFDILVPSKVKIIFDSNQFDMKGDGLRKPNFMVMKQTSDGFFQNVAVVFIDHLIDSNGNLKFDGFSEVFNMFNNLNVGDKVFEMLDDIFKHYKIDENPRGLAAAIALSKL